MTIDKTIKSKYQPKQTNVTWVDLSGETPVEKHFVNGRWRSTGGSGSSNILYCEGSDDRHGLITAYIDSSELDNPQITTIAVDTGGTIYYFYRMWVDSWLVSRFSSFEDRNEWVKKWNTEGQYPTIEAYLKNK